MSRDEIDMITDVTSDSIVEEENYFFDRYTPTPLPRVHSLQRYTENSFPREGRDLVLERYPENILLRDHSPERYPENSSSQEGQSYASGRYPENLLHDDAAERYAETLIPRDHVAERYPETSLPRNHATERYPETSLHRGHAAERYPETSLPRDHSPDRYPDKNPQSPPSSESQFETRQREVSHSILLEYVQETIKSVHAKRDGDKELLLKVKEEAESQLEEFLHGIDLGLNRRYEAHQNCVQSKLEQLTEVLEDIDTLEKELQQFKTVLGHLNNEVKL